MADVNDPRSCEIDGCALLPERRDITLNFDGPFKKIQVWLCGRHWLDLQHGDSSVASWFAQLKARAK